MPDIQESPHLSQAIEPTPGLRIGLTVVSILLAVLVFILYLPTLSAPALYDENYLLAWWKNLLQAGLFSHESLTFLGFAGCDLRDATGPYGNLATLIFAALSGGKIALMHFAATSLHLGNCLLLFGTILKVQSLARANSSQSTDSNLASFSAAVITALVFALSPLAPEAVSWLGGFPILLGTNLSLLAFLLLCFSASNTEKQTEKRNLIISSIAGCLALLASLCSAHLAAVVFFPAVCVYLATRKIVDRQTIVRKIIVVYLLGATIGALYSSFIYLGRSPENASNIPPKIAALKEPKVEAQSEPQEESQAGPGGNFLTKSLGNISALVIPINKSINKNYNKSFKLSYLLLPAPLIFTLVALMLSAQLRNRIGIALAFTLLYLLLNREGIDRETLTGARWLYPILPTFSFLVASTLASPMFIQWSKFEDNLIGRIVKSLVCMVLVVCTTLFFIPLAHTQISSFKSQGKLWTKLSQSIAMLGGKEKSAYLIVRNLPQSLSIAPIISPFEPVLIDTAEKLPRSQNISAGALKDCLRNSNRENKIGNIVFHFEKHLVDLIKTDFEVTNQNFTSPLTAQQIAKRVTPPIEFYRGTVKLDGTGENLLLESANTNGAAVRIDCEGLSPVKGDYLYVEAKINGPPLQPHTPVEMHWLTNWNIEWEPRDRKTQVDAFANDNLYHRYFFPLRSTGWTTNGFPSHIMLGFPAGANVAIKAIGISGGETSNIAESASVPPAESIMAPPAPLLTAQASLAQSQGKRRFAAFSFNYPDLQELGLTAVYGKDNSLLLNYDASKVESATAVKFEIGLPDSKFKADNAEYPETSSTTIDQRDNKGTFTLKATDQPIASRTAATGTVFPIRVFALDQSGKIIGRSSDSVHCLIDWNLSAK
jgi:hypothetical protein